MTVLAKDKTFSSSERSLYMLLADHPHFIRGIEVARKKLLIPRQGFTDGQSAFNWEHLVKNNKDLARVAADALIADFNINSVFLTEARHFTYDFLLSPKIVSNRLPLPSEWSARDKQEVTASVSRHKIGARTIGVRHDKREACVAWCGTPIRTGGMIGRPVGMP